MNAECAYAKIVVGEADSFPYRAEAKLKIDNG